MSALTGFELAAIATTTALAYVANAAPSRLLVPGLSWPHAIGADLAGRAVVSTIPGPTDIATKFVLYRQWAIPADVATAGIVFNAFFETLSDLILPLIATVGVLLAGHSPRPAVAALSADRRPRSRRGIAPARRDRPVGVLGESAGSRAGVDRGTALAAVPPSPALRDRRGRDSGPRAVARDPVTAWGPRVRRGRPRASRVVPRAAGLAVGGRRVVRGAGAVGGPDGDGGGRRSSR
jgi:hypothetical protein